MKLFPVSAVMITLACAQAGEQAVEASGLRLTLPEGWRTVAPEQVELANKLLVAMLSRDRTAEFSIACAFVAPKSRFLEVLGGSGGSGGFITELKGGATPEEILLYAQKGLRIVIGELFSRRHETGIELDEASRNKVFAPAWSDAADAAVAEIPVTASDGSPMLILGYLAPTKRGCCLIGCKVTGPDREKLRMQVDAAVKGRSVAQDQEVSPEFLATYRRLVDQAAAEASRRNRRADMEAAWGRKRDEARTRANAGGDPAAACAIMQEARALLKQLEDIDPTRSSRWRAFQVEVCEETASWQARLHQPDKSWAEIADGERLLESVPDAERPAEMWNAASRLHMRAAEILRNFKRDFAAERDRRSKALESRMRTGWALNSEENIRWTSVMHLELASACQAAGDAANARLEAARAAELIMSIPQDVPAAGTAASVVESLSQIAGFQAAAGDPAAGQTLTRFVERLRKVAERSDIGSGPQAALLRAERNAIGIMVATPGLSVPGATEMAAGMVARAARLRDTSGWSPECDNILKDATGQFAVKPEAWLAESLELQRKAGNVAYTEGAGPRGFPRRDAAASPAQIDLTEFYNAILDRNWQSKNGNYHLGNLPKGLQRFDGVTFDVRGVIQIFGGGRDRHLVWPAAIEGIRIGQKFSRLHLLHGTGWSEGEAALAVATIRLHFVSGRSADLPVVYGRDVRDWNAGTEPESATPNGATAWTGTGGGGQKLRLFHSAFANPVPAETVAGMDFLTTGRTAALFIVAVTVDP